MIRQLKIRNPEPEPTEEELAIALEVRTEIEALFGGARDAVCPDECCAYLRTPERDYVYDVLKNGHWQLGGCSVAIIETTPIETDARAAVVRSIGAVRKRFKARHKKQIVWRTDPEFRRRPACGASWRAMTKALPERVELYLRFTVTPLGV